MKKYAAGWRKLARRLGGPLETDRVAVRGNYEGWDVTVTTHWHDDGTAHRTTFRLGSPAPIKKEHRGTWRRGDDVPTGYRPAAKKIATALLVEAMALMVEEDCARLHDVAPLAAKRVEQRLEQLAGLTATLIPKMGPYR